MSEWQPIETAPKDGTTVMLFHPEDGYTDACGYMCASGDWVLISRGGCVYAEEGRDPLLFDDPKPSHWMPLPAPPEAA